MRNTQDPKEVRNSTINKLKEFSSVLSEGLIFNVLTLYYLLIGNGPLRVKASVLLALAYFIFPLDSIPDLAPVVGFTDDTAVILALIASLDKEDGMEKYRRQAKEHMDAQYKK
jgi:uncharacterized membrane protein YkvA (DUF1232 family)